MHDKLQRILDLPIRDRDDVKACFDFCQTIEDIREVIRKIPKEFGEFDILHIDEREGYFMIHNFFEKEGSYKYETVSYDFYNIKDDYYYDFNRR